MMKFIENIGDYYSQHFFADDFHRKVFDKVGYVTQKKDSDGNNTENHISQINARITPLRQKYIRFKNDLLNLKREEDKVKRTHDFHTEVLDALGYGSESATPSGALTNNPQAYNQPIYLNEKEAIPVRLNYTKGGKPYLFVMEMKAIVHVADKETEGIYDQTWTRDDWKRVFPESWKEVQFHPDVVRDALSELFLLPEDERPTYVILLAGAKIFLIHYEKWKYDSFLLFDLEELFVESTTNRDYLALFYALLAKDNFMSSSDSLLQSLDEDAHKAAYGVTQNLKNAVIFAVESLANEAIWYKKEQANTLTEKDAIEKLMADESFARELKNECLTLVYRLLFLFYAEAREDLEILPIRDTTYQRGYSLEMLRDLEMIPLTTDSSRNGDFFSQSLWKLFDYLHNGVKTENGFSMKPLDSPLFDNKELKLLVGVQFRNFVLQKIIFNLSLSNQSKGKRRGRISYANLGINQLGSVYESLLAFNGFFAAETLLEVKKADDADGKEGTFLVPLSRRDEFADNEILKDPENPQFDKQIPRGQFVYRLNGRDRKKSASFYTPEVLTQTTVKYTLKGIIDKLKERQEAGEDCAEELLKLKILEPAMGAAAFQNEVINQLAVMYLELKETEEVRRGGRRIVPGNYTDELQKVKAYIAANNVYGVDLNPTAVELGKLSLWLNCMHRNMETPFFAHRLGVGNAVVGCWLKVYDQKDVNVEYPAGTTPGKNAKPVAKAWWTKAPKRITWLKDGNLNRKPNQYYHFLLPDENMLASAGISLIKSEFNDAQKKAVADWKAEIKKPLNADECLRLEKISKVIDTLLIEHSKQIQGIIKDTTSIYKVYGVEGQQTTLKGYDEKEHLTRTLNSRNSPFYKLRTIMDYWCSLWFWDARRVADLPTRAQWYNEVENILGVDLSHLDENADARAILENIWQHAGDQSTLFGTADRLQTVEALRTEHRFFHHELEFLEVFKERGGFDIVVGNPPWVVVNIDLQGFLSEVDPICIVRDYDSALNEKLVLEIIEKDSSFKNRYFKDLIGIESSKSFFGATGNYYLLQGQKSNLHKLVIENSLNLSSGMSGIIHDKGIYEDNNGQLFRKTLYQKLDYYFQFQNEKKLFSDVGNTKKFEISIFNKNNNEINFQAISNLFHPNTIDQCFSNTDKLILGIRDEKNDWETRGNQSRVIKIDSETLKIYSALFDEGTNYEKATLANIHSSELNSVLLQFNSQESKLKDFAKNISATIMLDETKAKRDGLINKKPGFVPDEKFILAAPHFYVGNPLFQTPNENCSSHRDNSAIDLTQVDENYLPRTVYELLTDGDAINKNDNYFYVNRKRAQPSNERTLMSCIQPPHRVHTIGSYSLHFKDELLMLSFSAYSFSIVYDFYVRITNREDILFDTISNLPIFKSPNKYIINRALLINCITKKYESLWNKYSNLLPIEDRFSNNSLTLNNKNLNTKDVKWTFEIPLKDSYSRRQALIEIDVLVALELNLTWDEFLTIYKIQFPVLASNESRLLFDQNGREIDIISKREYLKDIESDRVKSNYNGFIPPFIKVDRVEDYKVAWSYFKNIYNVI